MRKGKNKKGNEENDIFLTKPAKPNHKLEGFSKKMEWIDNSFAGLERRKETLVDIFNHKRMKWLILFFFVLVSIILGRVFYLQVMKTDHYRSMSEGNKIRIKRIEPTRGIIYDSSGIPLVQNISNFMLYIVPGDLPEDKEGREKIFNRIKAVLGDNNIDIGELEESVKKGERDPLKAYQPIFIEDNIDYEKAILLYLETQKMPGVVLSNKETRHYLSPSELSVSLTSTSTKDIIGQSDLSSLSHIIGYTGKISPEELKEVDDIYSHIDYIGKSGLEYYWEKELKGAPGKKQIEVDALGKEHRVINTEDPEHGSSLGISLDVMLQAKIENIVKDHIGELEADKASVVVMNPNNGEILAMVSWPGFDNNAFSRGISQGEFDSIINEPGISLFNRSVKGEYPSGSIIKPIILAGALEERVVSKNTKINSTGGIRIDKWSFPDWKSGGHGIVDARRAIAESVNTYFYYIGGGYQDFRGLGLERILEYDMLFGLGTTTGVDLPSENSGFLPDEEWKKEELGERWYIGDTYHLSIGQGFLLVTPIQVANFTSVFANRGTLHKPHLVSKIINRKGDVIKKVPPQVIRENFIKPYNLEVVRQGMRMTVTQGSARSLGNLGVEVAGKTGTAQWASEEDPHSWFTCFAPYKKPEIVVTVLVEEGGEGTHTAVPITKEIIKYYFDKGKDRK